MFVSCWRWDSRAEEWKETGRSVNLGHVDWISVESLSGGFALFCYRHGDPPGRVVLVQGGNDRDSLLRFVGALLYNAGIPHFPPLPKVDMEVARHPGGLAPPPGSQN